MVDISSKELVKGLFQFKQPPRTAFIPWVCSFAAQLEQVSVEEMLSDPGLLSSSLLNAQELFGYDAIVNVFDTTLEAEACGCEIEWGEEGALPKVVSHPLEEGATIESLDIANLEKRGRIPTVMESTKRLKIIRGKQVAIIGMVTGPLTLASHLSGDSFLDYFNLASAEAANTLTATANITLKLSKHYCELGVDAVVVVDELLGSILPERYKSLAGPLKSIWNVTKFYGVNSLILTGVSDVNVVASLFSLQPDGVVVSGDIDCNETRDMAVERKLCYGVGIPTSVFLGETSGVADSVKQCLPPAGKGSFLSTEWDIPYATNVNAMHEVMSVVRAKQ
jgi:uroporphyrinogen decarboxylase